MNRRLRTVGLASLIGLATVSLPVTAQQRRPSVNDQQVRDLVERVDASVTAFRASVDWSGRGSRVGDRDDLDRSAGELHQATVAY
jgi:hypothetical protein